VLFGVPALYSIRAARGAKKGAGMAVTGIVTGLIGAALGTALLFGASRGLAWIASPVQNMAHVEALDAAAAQPAFISRVRGQITAEQLRTFRDAYHGAVGAYQGPPQGPLEWLTMYGEASPAADSAIDDTRRLYDFAMPVPAHFAKGTGYVLLVIDNTSGPDPLALENIGVVDNDTGKVIWLLAPEGGATAPGDPAGAEGDGGDGG
jgi:hypothetical protein